MVHCVVSNCKSRHGKSANGEKISFHKFPLAKKLRLEWEKLVGRTNFKCTIQSSKTARLCSLHFTDDCYSVSRTTATSMGHSFVRWKLKDDALPTLFNNEPCVVSNDVYDAHKSDPVKMDVTETEQKYVPNFGEVAQLNRPVKNGVITEEVMKSSNACTRTKSDIDGILPGGGKPSCQALISTDNDNTISSSTDDVFKNELGTVSSGKRKCSSVDPSSKTDYLSEIEVEFTQDDCSEKGDIAVCEKHDDVVCEDSIPLSNFSGVEIGSEEAQMEGSSQFIEPKCELQYEDHICGESSFFCESCGLFFGDEAILNQHLASCKLNDNIHIFDRNCVENVSTNFNGLQTTVKETNTQKERATEACKIIPICLSDYESRSTSTLFICACGFATFESVEFVDHSSMHWIEETFACAICKDVFNNFLLLQKHVHRSQHYWTMEGKFPSPKAVLRPQPVPMSIPVSGVISQPFPKPSLSSLGTCKAHSFNSDHDYASDGKGGAMDLTINGLEHVGGSFKCGLCPFSSSSARDLLNHRKVHGSSLKQKSSIEAEEVDTKRKCNGIVINDNDMQLLRCDICGYSTKSAIELLQHKTFHSSVGPFRCNLCSYATKSAIDLLQHKRDQSCFPSKESNGDSHQPSHKSGNDETSHKTQTDIFSLKYL